ncbi:MAG TPA: BatD family protein [Polyangia bacterium]|jgi:hypothetical protein|nr:BatD family protein [Polyangia bacterium]
MRVVAMWIAGALLAMSMPAHAAGVAADGGAAADPEAPTVAARVDKTNAHVGDVIALTLTAISRKGVPVNLPNTIDLGAFSILDRKEAEQDLGDARTRREFTLTVAAYEPGEVEIPSVEVTYLGKTGEVRSARTAPVAIKIASLIANEPEPALKDNAPPVVVWQQNLLLVYVAGGLLAAALGALAAWLIVRRLRARALDRPGPPPRPAHEIALERLDRLGGYGFLENADNRPFYFAVSEVIRDYLGARFGFDSLEMTTDELMSTLRKRAAREHVLTDLTLVEIESWLSGCDLVKFAKISPTAAESRGTLETALRVVSSTRPRPAEADLPAGTVQAAGAAPPREAAGG